MNQTSMKYECTDCETGYWWDGCLCRACVMPGCLDCKDEFTCNTCEDHLLLELDDSACVPFFDHCKAHKSNQPKGLFHNFDLGVYECSIC